MDAELHRATTAREECLREAAIVYLNAFNRIMYAPLPRAAQGYFSDGLTFEERVQGLFQNRRAKFIEAGATDGPDLWQYIVDGDPRYY